MRKYERLYENTHIFIPEDVTEEHQIPIIGGIDDTENIEYISFNYAMTEKHPENKGVHFYLDDYQFERVWRDPRRYVEILSRFKYVMSPDFSMYTDYPYPLQLYSHYKKHWVAAFLESYGIEVIPSICWSDESSFEWCFEGEPVGKVVSVSSIGCSNSKAKRDAFNAGYNAMMEKLKPAKVVFFGKDILEDDAGRSIVEFHNPQSIRRMDNLDEQNKS